MTSFKSSYLQEVHARGFIHQGTNLEALDEKMAKESVTAYIGFDATATSLHVGNLVQIMQLRLLQKHGHKPLVLMGDGTTRIGDPSGKDASRQLLTPEKIDENVAGIQKIFSKYLSFGEGQSDALMLRNSEWLLPLNYLDFLQNYGRHFSVNRMLSFDSVKLRLEREQNLSFLEFNYMIFQAYDFLELSKAFNCELQLGGSDQWGNIVNGVELTRRVTSKEVFGLTAPLITTADGKKMGKSVDGAIWLNADALSTFDFWQFWRNTQDADVGRFLRLYTDIELDEIARLEKLEGAEINEAKIILADAATKMCHGESAVQQAKDTAKTLFETGGAAQSLDNLPFIEVARSDLEAGILAVELFRQVDLAKSNGEARRLVRGGGAKINDVAFSDENTMISLEDLQDNSYIKLSAGKKRHGLIKVV
ncbi:MAG TPA: tyrosine--tRNA ligase [Holosporales bacterium]|nr:tyrosine--tRNA ligase [Holosporales bacterium]